MPFKSQIPCLLSASTSKFLHRPAHRLLQCSRRVLQLPTALRLCLWHKSPTRFLSIHISSFAINFLETKRIVGFEWFFARVRRHKYEVPRSHQRDFQNQSDKFTNSRLGPNTSNSVFNTMQRNGMRSTSLAAETWGGGHFFTATLNYIGII